MTKETFEQLQQRMLKEAKDELKNEPQPPTPEEIEQDGARLAVCHGIKITGLGQPVHTAIWWTA